MSQREKILLGLSMVVVIMLMGTIGYRWIEEWTWFDSFYMTVITLTTIGYGELPGMTEPGRYFTVALILVGLTAVAYTASMITQSLIESEIIAIFGRRRVNKAIDRLTDHFIICGAGRVGSKIAREMAGTGIRFVVIEKDPQVSAHMAEQNYLVLQGDATDEQTLREAGIAHAQGLACTAATDADNVYTALTARDLNPNLYIVARANEETAESKLRKAGANKVVSPTRIGSHQMAQALLKPLVSDFIELATMAGPEDLALEATHITERCPLVDVSLKDSGIRSKLDLIVVAIRRQSGETLFNPSGETRILAEDRLLAVGKRDSLIALKTMAGPPVRG